MSSAVITGGASGFGRALADRCAARGMQVALLDRDGDRVIGEAEVIAAEHEIATVGIEVDVVDPDSVAEAARKVDNQFGSVDLLVSNVGVQLFGSVERFTDDEWRWVLDINVIGSARVVREFLPLLRRSTDSHIAFTTSSSVLDPASRLGAYQASKFAVWGIAETLRLELADEAIAISVLFPSGMLSRHLESSEAAQPESLRRPIGEEEDFIAMANSNPGLTSALATPEDAARSVIDAVFANDRYVITHGDLVDAVVSRCGELELAAKKARNRWK